MRLAALFAAVLGAGLLFLPVSASAALPVAPPVDSAAFAPGVSSFNFDQPGVTAPGIIKAQVSGSIHFGRPPTHWHGSRRHPHWCRYRWRGRCYPYRFRGVHFHHRRWCRNRWCYW